MGRRVLRFDGPLARGLWWRPSGADYKKSRPTPSVISTEAGQPPIGKPLIVQARGQLRLTWRLYAESPQSGEIPPLMVRAALRQEIFRLRVSSERFAATPCGGRGGCGFPFLPHKKGCDEMIFISSQPFYLFFFQPTMKFHLPGAAGRTFPVPTAAAAAAAQGDPVNMTAGQNEADGNDSQYCVSANTHGYPSFLRE